MTTLTEPPLITPAIDVDELPAWDQPDERACELADQDSGQPCERHAAWLLVCDAADCGHFHGPVLICAPCKAEILAAETLVMCPEQGCLLACYIRWIEAL